jgi:S1-C subfamily serine protease
VITSSQSRQLFGRFRSSVLYVATRRQNGEERIGSCFHVGEGVFVTARHVVEGNRVVEVGVDGVALSGSCTVERVCVHPDPSIDVAALVIRTTDALPPTLQLGTHLDKELASRESDAILQPVVVMGYPPVPFADRPILVAASAEINGVVYRYNGRHPTFIISAMPRGGFSGGPAVLEDGDVLGVITEALLRDDSPPELGFFAVMTVEPIYDCLRQNNILPPGQDPDWWVRHQNAKFHVAEGKDVPRREDG